MIKNAKSKLKLMLKPERLRKPEIINLEAELKDLRKGDGGSVRKDSHIREVCEETGWGKSKAVEKLYHAECLGISSSQYVSKKLFQLNEEELIEFALFARLLKRKHKRDNDFYISAVCKKTGWTREEALSEMDIAKKNGVSYLKFVQNEYWSRKDKDTLGALIRKNKSKREKNKEQYLSRVCGKTGWSEGKAELEMTKAKVNCGASHEDFLVFKLYEKSADEQKKYVTLDAFIKMRLKYNEHRLSVKNFVNKANFNRHFETFVQHKWFVNRNMSYEKFLDSINGLSKLIVKPLGSTQGAGIEVFNCNSSEDQNMKLYGELMNRRRSIVEEYIIQNGEMAKFCETSVNTVRVMTLNYEHECKFLYSVFRIGRGGVVDNFHAGGIAAAVDIETGVVCTNAVDLDGNIFTHSPATGVVIKGFQIPYWDQIISACKEITGKIEGTNLVGWDFAVTEKGIDLIEGNPGASYVVAQIPYVEEGRGLMDVMVEPYLEESDWY